MRQKQYWVWSLMAGMSTLLGLGMGPAVPVRPSFAQQPNPANLQPSYISAEQIAIRFYRQVPDFPKADNYKTTNSRITVSSTLVERLVLYHTRLKGRTPQRRFDWKLTLADFMGLNDPISPQSYPGRDYLERNPLDEDRAIIRQFNRQQRNQLIQTLVDLYTPAVARDAAPNPVPVPRPPASPIPATPPASRIPPTPQQGGAGLLTTPESEIKPFPRPGDARLLLP